MILDCILYNRAISPVSSSVQCLLSSSITMTDWSKKLIKLTLCLNKKLIREHAWPGLALPRPLIIESPARFLVFPSWRSQQPSIDHRGVFLLIRWIWMEQERLEKFRITKIFLANHQSRARGLPSDKIWVLGVCCLFLGPASAHVLGVTCHRSYIKPVLKITRSGVLMDREILKQNYGLLALKTIQHSI